ncbi:hypothetical protein [Actinokineospora sp. HUAS TT18]|uniref:hypothetical protein n=1 Tax=Actinokineospora sp. HUAS TT18 TaxID=3447451 RepID=UPI003F52538F
MRELLSAPQEWDSPIHGFAPVFPKHSDRRLDAETSLTKRQQNSNRSVTDLVVHNLSVMATLYRRTH